MVIFNKEVLHAVSKSVVQHPPQMSNEATPYEEDTNLADRRQGIANSFRVSVRYRGSGGAIPSVSGRRKRELSRHSLHLDDRCTACGTAPSIQAKVVGGGHPMGSRRPVDVLVYGVQTGWAVSQRCRSVFSVCVSRLRQFGKAHTGIFGEGISVKDPYLPSLARAACRRRSHHRAVATQAVVRPRRTPCRRELPCSRRG